MLEKLLHTLDKVMRAKKNPEDSELAMTTLVNLAENSLWQFRFILISLMFDSLDDSTELSLSDPDILLHLIIEGDGSPTTKAALEALSYVSQSGKQISLSSAFSGWLPFAASGKQVIKQHGKLMREIGRLATSHSSVQKEAKACLQNLGFQSQAKAWARLVVKSTPKLRRPKQESGSA